MKPVKPDIYIADYHADDALVFSIYSTGSVGIHGNLKGMLDLQQQLEEAIIKEVANYITEEVGG